MEEQIKTAPQTDVEVVDIQFRSGQKIYFFDPDGQRFADGDHIIIDTARGEEFGICVGGNHKIPPKNVVAPLRKVLRRATPQDEKTIQENRAKEKRAFEVCQQKIAEHGLDMQLVNAEVAFDGSKILFYFTADERVDFRELVKDLASDLKIAEKKIALIEEQALRELKKSERLQIYREDIISRYSLRGTFSAFKNSRMSAPELAVIKLDELEQKELRHLERKEWDAEAHRQKRAAWADAILNTKGRKEHGKNQ